VGRKDQVAAGTGDTKASLGEVQETLLATLYARAVESEKKKGLLDDRKAVEVVRRIDYDFTKFDGSPTLLFTVLRTLILDQWVRDFLDAHPDGTVVEIGAGLNSRYERLDNDRARWIDIDLPDALELRRVFFADTERRRSLAASVLDDAWRDEVAGSPGPYMFVIEGVLLYFAEDEVRAALGGIAAAFPGARVALDTASAGLVENQDHPALKKELAASFTWACDDPKAIDDWDIGLKLDESRGLVDLQDAVLARMRFSQRKAMSVARMVFRDGSDAYRINLFRC
jgi:O-methyltransferase involved in polyketide biosynthesis